MDENFDILRKPYRKFEKEKYSNLADNSKPTCSFLSSDTKRVVPLLKLGQAVMTIAVWPNENLKQNIQLQPQLFQNELECTDIEDGLAENKASLPSINVSSEINLISEEDENIRNSQSIKADESRKSVFLNKAKIRFSHHIKSSNSEVLAASDLNDRQKEQEPANKRKSSILKNIIYRKEDIKNIRKSSLNESRTDLKLLKTDLEDVFSNKYTGIISRDKQLRESVESPSGMQPATISNPSNSALKSFEALVGSEISRQLMFDYSSKIKDPVRKQSSVPQFKIDHNSIDLSNSTAKDNLNISVSGASLTLAANHYSPKQHNKQQKSADELNTERRQKADEYYNIEVKQANLLKLLMNSVYLKFKSENERQQYALCDKDSMENIFNIVITLASFADLVHGEVATQIQKRIESEWSEKPYFGDILVAKSPYYQTYKPVLQRFSECQMALSNMLKKKNFANYLKMLLEKESASLEKVNRIDILFDRLVDFPRRIVQLLESYLKCLEPLSKEHQNISSCLDIFTKIFERSNDELNKTSNFQACLYLQEILHESSNFKENIANSEHPLIKQGPIYKVAKRSGELQLRHLAVFTDKLILSKVEKLMLKKTLRFNYKISGADLKLVEMSSDSDELKFRLVSLDQNNEFRADRMRDKEEWLRAFHKMQGLEVVATLDNRYSKNVMMGWNIGVDPPIWIPDSAQENCSCCKETFNLVKRRHHCRTCGKLYCSDCSNFKVAVKYTEYKDKVRVCKMCFNFLEPIYLEHQIKHGNFPTESPSKLSPFSYNSISKRIKDLSSFREIDQETDRSEIYETTEKLDEGPEKEIPKVMKRLKQEQFNDSSSSSSLTDDQMQVLNNFFQNNEKNDKSTPDESDLSDLSETEEEFSNLKLMGDSLPVAPAESITFLSPHTKITENLVQNITDESLLNKKLDCRPYSINFKLFGKARDHEVSHAEYCYVSKVSILSNTLDDMALNSPEKNSNKKWNRNFIALYTDKTLGICSSKNDVKSPELIIQLKLYIVKNIDELTLGLELVDNCTINESQEKKEIEEQEPESDINNLKELTHFKKNSSPNSKLGHKLKIFETNFEFKFTGISLKKQWFDLLTISDVKLIEGDKTDS